METQSFFNLAKFGNQIREQRIQAGFSTIKELSEAIEKTSGIPIHPKTLEKIELGTSGIPSVEKVAAIVATIQDKKGEATGAGFSHALGKVVFGSLPERFISSALINSLRKLLEGALYSIDFIEAAAGALAAHAAFSNEIIKGKAGGIEIDGETFYKGAPLHDEDLRAEDRIAPLRILLSSLETEADKVATEYPGERENVEAIKGDITETKKKLERVATDYETARGYFD